MVRLASSPGVRISLFLATSLGHQKTRTGSARRRRDGSCKEKPKNSSVCNRFSSCSSSLLALGFGAELSVSLPGSRARSILTHTDRLKKGSVPTLYPASKEPKTRISIGGGFGGGNSPPNGHHNHQQQPDHDSLILSMSTKRPLPAHQQQSQQPVAKRRSLPPAATSAATLATHAAVSGALAGLIQRQQLKEQQRKAFAAALQLQVLNDPPHPFQKLLCSRTLHAQSDHVKTP